jgi:hypothetical protein
VIALLLGLAVLGAIAFGLELALRREEIPGFVPPERSESGGRTVELFFPGVSSGWVRERREILASESREIMIRRLLEQLLQGPSSKASSVFPQATRLVDVFWDGEGELTVIFSEHLRTDHPGGSRAETATIESLLGSVKLNFPEVQRVRILIEGEIVASIAGHVDISGPLDAFIPR